MERFFGALARGVSFDTKRIKGEKKHFKNGNEIRSLSITKNASELDFFGFDAVAPKTKEHKGTVRERKLSVDMVPSWAGNEPKQKKKGSKPRRKRKLSAGAIEEVKLEEEERKNASMMLAPKHTTSTKRKSRCSSIGSEVSETALQSSSDSENEEVEEVEVDEEKMSLFPNGPAIAQVETDKIKSRKKKKTQTDEPMKESDRVKEEIRIFRKQMGIRINSDVNIPPPMATFDSIPLDQEQSKMRSILLKNIERSEYKEPTPIQMQAIPSMLTRRDVLATAPTGSGKTAAFVIPILANLSMPKQEGIRSIILSPTRELAVQIYHECQRLSLGRKFHMVLLSKATSATMQSSIKNHCRIHQDILIATPLRLVHLIQQIQLDLSMVEMLVLDEADRLFDMGFIQQIDEILAACSNEKIQRAMFSATMLQGVEEMAQSVLRDPIQISIGMKNASASSITQELVFVGKEQGKLLAIKQLIQQGLDIPALVFVQNKERANELYHELLYDGIHVGTVHADRTKEQRDETIRQFRMGQVWVLICTDLMSRGMDFKAVNMVINYDFPQDAVSYIHRIGRTGRGGRTGRAVTLFTEDDMMYLRSIANVMKLSGCDVPDWMLTLKKASALKRKQLIKAPIERRRISTVSGYDLQRAHKRKQMKRQVIA